MNSAYNKAIELGFTDDNLIEEFSKRDSDFKNKYEKAIQLGYKPEEIFTKAQNHYQSKKENINKDTKEFGIKDYAKDIGKQSVQGFGIGSLGTYGDLLDFFGLQSKDILPGEKEKYNREFEVLEKIQKGERPSTSDLMELSDDDQFPRFSRLPNSQDIGGIGEKLGVVTEAETAAGRFAKRSGKLLGASSVLGSSNIKAPIGAGIAGQAIEEAGGPPWMQAAAEIIATLKLSPKTAQNITSKSPEVEKTIQDLRKAGFAEQDITLAKNALEERKLLKKYASLTPEAENAIQSGVKNSEKLLEDQLKKGLPGYAEGGLPYLEKQASNVYQTMEDVASTIKVNNVRPVQKAIKDSIDYLEKYPLLKEQKEFIEFLKDGLTKSENANTAEFFTGFYRNLGRAGNWGNPKQKEHILGIVKNGIKETFNQSGKEAQKFGKYFEQTNEAWKKWLNAKDLMETFEKSQSVDGVNFKKLSSSLNDPGTYELAKKVLGNEQVKNIDIISKGAQTIESLIKQIPKSDKSLQSLKFLSGVISLMKGDYRPLAAIASMQGAERLATSLLTDPKKQNIMKKIITAAKNNSPQQAAILAKELM